MSFLAPLFLFGLLAGLIPLAIHLIRKEKPPKVLFSTLRFFKKTSRKQFLFQKIQQWLLLLLRAGIVVALAFAFSRPFFNQALSRWADIAPKSVVILFDTSMSMAYPGYLAEAKREARQIIDELNPGDEAAMITFAESPQQINGLTEDYESLLPVIEKIEQPTQQATRFFPAIRMADELLKEARFEEKIVYMISDFQSGGMQEFDNQWKLQPGVAFSSIDIATEDTRNIAVTGVKSPAQIRGDVEYQVLFARVRSLGGVRQDKSTLRVDIDGEEQLRQSVDLSGQSEVVVELPVRFEGEGSHTGKISVLEDGFVADNDFYFTVDVLPKIQVAVVNGEASNNWYDDEGHWFSLAVKSTDQSPFELQSLSPNQVNSSRLSQQDVVVLLNVGALQSSQTNALQDYVREGGSVLLAPGDRVDPREFNQQFADIAPATLINHGNLLDDDYLVIADMERRHPILQNLDIDWNVRFEDNWQLQPVEDAETLMSFDNGMPTLVERQVGEGRVLLFASPLDLEWNNLPLQGMYLPFVHEMLKHLAQTPKKESSYRVGDSVALLNGVTGISDPSGQTVSLAEGLSNLTLSQVGLYSAELGQQELFYAVNSPLSESDLSTVSSTDILDQVLNPETKPTQSAEVRSQLLSIELERPQRVWWYLLLLVALLLMVESFISNRTYR